MASIYGMLVHRRLTIDELRRLAHASLGVRLTKELVFQVKRPYRWLCRLTIDWRFPFYRSWNSAIPMRLLISMLHGYSRDYRYRGVPMLKNPIDLALYAELLWDLNPRTIIEIGSKAGGSALWFAAHCPGAQVISIDLVMPGFPINCAHERILFMQGDESRLQDVALDWGALPHPWLVVNDASHRADVMLPGMLFLDRFIRPGDYFVIEDGIMSDMGFQRGGGPSGAIQRFLKERPHYRVASEYCDKFGYNVTGNPNGYLVKT